MELVRALTPGVGLYDCATCHAQPYLLAALGHDGPGTLYPRNLVTEAPLAECPRRTLLRAEAADPRAVREATRYREVYAPAYEAGFLPSSGGVEDQSARVMAGMQRLTHLRGASQAKYDALRPTETPSG